MMTDPVADMLTRIRNASLVHKKEAVVPYSKLKMNIAKILEREGFLDKAEEITEGLLSILLKLKYVNGVPAIQHIERISKPGHRRYVSKDEIKSVLNGFGISIISTSKGILTNKEAKKNNIGGELICEVY
ncbi:MAG: 30S ribosomal protein S8 [Patescibacteria group bacterium]